MYSIYRAHELVPKQACIVYSIYRAHELVCIVYTERTYRAHELVPIHRVYIVCIYRAHELVPKQAELVSLLRGRGEALSYRSMRP